MYHTCGTRNLYTGGYFSGFDIIDEIMDIIRREAEQCDHLVGFSNISSIAGGTGSGLGTLILQKIQ